MLGAHEFEKACPRSATCANSPGWLCDWRRIVPTESGRVVQSCIPHYPCFLTVITIMVLMGCFYGFCWAQENYTKKHSLVHRAAPTVCTVSKDVSFHFSLSLSQRNAELIYQWDAAIFKGHCILHLRKSGSYWGSLLNLIIFEKAKTTWMLLIDTCIYGHKYSCL